MKTKFNHHFVLPALIVGLRVIMAGRVAAQTFTTLYTFSSTTPSSPYVNSDGAWPTAPLLLSSNRLYGTTACGGSEGCGVMFGIKPDGTGFTNLYTFVYADRSQGIYPKAGLLLTNNLLYGTDAYGGAGAGSVFSLSTGGTGFTFLHTFPRLNSSPPFANSDGAVPSGALLLSGDTFYGTAAYGGGAGHGTLYAVKTNGADFRVLRHFAGSPDGSRPQATLVSSPSGSTLYGTTPSGGSGQSGGSGHDGTVFAVNTDGTGYTIVHNFSYSAGDGSWPKCGLVLSASGHTLYGTTTRSGSGDSGTVFAVNTDGSGFTTLHHFTATTPPIGGTNVPLNSDGAIPKAALILSDAGNILYGTTSAGGSGGWGTIFAVNTDGTGFTTLHSCASGDEFQPNRLILAGKTLYGTTEGAVFSLALGLSATVSATPARAQMGESIEVVVRVHNDVDEVLRSVRLDGPISVGGTGGVAPAGFRGPTMVPSLAPGASATFTYLYRATNYGDVTFTAAATGTSSEGVVTSAAATGAVTIALMADLLVKTADPEDTTFAGGGEFQPAPPFNDQDVSLGVSSNGVAGYIVRLQNDESVAQSYVLRGTTNGIANWAVTVLAGNANVFGALVGAGGWTTPELPPNGYLDLRVSLAPLPAAGVSDNKWIQLTALADGTSTTVLDALRLHATLVPVPVKVTIHKIGPGGYTSQSVQAGLTDINAPLVPALDPAVLANSLEVIHGGLVADGVTPLVIKLEADHDAIGQFGEGLEFVFQASIPAGDNSLAGAALGQRLAWLQNGFWQSATSVVLSASSPIAYVQLLPILSDDVVILYQPPGVKVDFGVQDKASGIQAGDVKFALQKPPIALVHGYATPGDWGTDFKAMLALSRPHGLEGSPENFICTVKYGQNVLAEQGILGLSVYVNTVASLEHCAQMLHVALLGAMTPLHSNWAFTRFDVVGHSQGGVLSRMLCNASPASTIPRPFRNDSNFNRGRFHRVVTIGSPHNGSRLSHYLLHLDGMFREDTIHVWRTWFSPAGRLGVLSEFAQPKFDPFLQQIRAINDPFGPWWPDPDARFHLVRATIDEGASPDQHDWTPSYLVLGLATELGGFQVIPRGSDGVVDYDSMGAQMPSLPKPANVFSFPKADYICHAEPIQLFNAVSSETASPAVANHVIFALDQRPTLPPGDIVFARFPSLPPLGADVQADIDSYAGTRKITALEAGPVLRPRVRDAGTSYQYQIFFPSNLPPVGDVTWFVQVYDSAGITDDGVALTPGGTNSSQVTVTVDGALVGDVVLSGVYHSVSNTMVGIPPTLVVSMPPAGATLTGFQLLPANIALPAGTPVWPQLVANYSDGSSSLRYAAPGTVTATSSQPSVVSVDDPLRWQLSSVGAAQINVTWSGFKAASQITVFDPATNTPPALSLQTTGNGQLAAAWAGFTTAYVLESSGDLQQTNSWQTVAAAPISAGGWTTVPVTVTNTQQFFRLRWDPSATGF